jgi:DNA-binding PadR family transcriptional regulator
MGLGGHVETAKFCWNMHRRIVRNFLDVLILAEMREGPLSGYDVMPFVHDRFRFLVGSGTIYSVLYSLERNGLISGASMQRKRVYRLTDKRQGNY